MQSIQTIASFYGVKVKTCQRYYRNKLSDFQAWEHRFDAERGLASEHNIGPRLSIDETSLFPGELYTIVTNKDAKGQRGTLLAIV